MSPTQRTLAHLRQLGYFAQVVEKWIPQARRRVDLFGWIDVVAVHPEQPGILGIQTTSGSNAAARIQKARESPGPLLAWLLAGGRLRVHGWAKRGPRGAPKRWVVREVEIGVQDLTGG